jgi:hypothetical protein
MIIRCIHIGDEKYIKNSGPMQDLRLSQQWCIFWDITPCSPLKINGRFGRIYRLLQGRRISQAGKQHKADSRQSTLPAACFMPVSFLVHSSTLKMEGTSSSETSVNFQRSTRHYRPQDRTLQWQVYWFKVSTFLYR